MSYSGFLCTGLYTGSITITATSGNFFSIKPTYNNVSEAHIKRERPILDLLKVEYVKLKMLHGSDMDMEVVVGYADWCDLIDENFHGEEAKYLKWHSKLITLAKMEIHRNNTDDEDAPSRFITCSPLVKVNYNFATGSFGGVCGINYFSGKIP